MYKSCIEKITEEMKTQEQLQREQIESQIRGLEGLIRSVRANLDLLQPEAIIEKLEYEHIIKQANDAIIYLKTELAKIPTQADLAFMELSQKVGTILEKYKDPLQKKKEALELEAKMVSEYVQALRKRYAEQAKKSYDHNLGKYGANKKALRIYSRGQYMSEDPDKPALPIIPIRRINFHKKFFKFIDCLNIFYKCGKTCSIKDIF
jgi:hypothetical protein